MHCAVLRVLICYHSTNLAAVTTVHNLASIIPPPCLSYGFVLATVDIGTIFIPYLFNLVQNVVQRHKIRFW